MFWDNVAWIYGLFADGLSQKANSHSYGNSPLINGQPVVQVRKEKGKQLSSDGVFHLRAT